MNTNPFLLRIVILAIGTSLTGCLFRPATVTTRQFVLTPARPASAPVTPTTLAVGLGAVKLPDYLLRNSLAVRKSELEIEYLENAVWAERLDQSFQRVLALNLVDQLPGSRVQRSTWLPREVALAAFVTVERFDVDARGNGTLMANWRIETSDRRKVIKDGTTTLTKASTAPRNQPEDIAATLSELNAQFSETLAQAIREAAAHANAP